MLSTRRQLELMRDLQRLANERQLAEERIDREYQQATTAAQAEHKRLTTAAEKVCQTNKEKSQENYRSALEELQSRYEQDRSRTQAEYQQVREEANERYTTTVREAREAKKQSSWQALAVFDASKNNPRERLEQVQQQLAARHAELDQLRRDAQEILEMRRLWRGAFANMGGEPATKDESRATQAENLEQAQAELDERMIVARDRVTQLHDDRVSRMFEGLTPLGMGLGLWVALIVVLGFIVGWPNWPVWLFGSLLGALVFGGIAGWVAWRRARMWATDMYQQIATDLAAAQGQIDLAAVVAREQSRREAQQLIATRDAELAAAESTATRTLAEIESWKTAQLADANQKYPALLTELRETLQAKTAELERRHHAELAEATAANERELRAAATARQESIVAAERQRDSAWQAMRQEWSVGFETIRLGFAEMNAECERLFPDWNQTDYESWPKPKEPTPAIQFGTALLELSKIKHALSANPELRPDVREFTVPTLITVREQPSLVVAAEGEGRGRAVELLQTLMVRYLTAMPPGKVRFTICDPVSLGESFASFMHLADHDEGLINGRIWSESRDIDEQLARLTNHMETILQKYLRNEYESIHEYNDQAGEVAEPFQVLSIANFPHGFSDAAAKRLLSLVTGGPRCGIYVLLSLDKKQRLPSDFDPSDLIAPSVHLEWDAAERRFVWRYPAFEHMPLSIAEPIDGASLVRLMKQAGKAAKESIKVEVPFEAVAPEPEKRWSQECDQELAVPIGRAGANRLQYVRLGKGTSQHLLVAGKTGSGKSTFLHALVTSGALHYSPEELEFYLVDFKKGVEFKSYATHHLPHARVIAIESEREFGISVLERLDLELRRRGGKFRSAGVQSLADYRESRPDEPMPRVLLVIDEFQELFVEDDKQAQQAGLLLDRLVRQGRAFGMHVLLGSQTLSGAYSLARSTLGQMAVRVALQCSEADAHLILSDERNQAARYLSRPGEAIYNDQNGLVSANQPFQVVWLPDRQRADYLAEINELRQDRGLAKREAIVFEGNAPADPRENRELVSLLHAPATAEVAVGSGVSESAVRNPRSAVAWLGAAVAIKPPTSVTFARHGGSNLLVVGQQEASALGVLTTAVISLAASTNGRTEVQQADGNREAPDFGQSAFVILDGSRPGEASEGVWQKVSDALGSRVQVVEQGDVPEAIGRVAAELARRDEANDELAPPVYLVIHNASRFRDLRKSEDDFSFSMDTDKPPAPDRQLAEILKNGPQWGIHALVWCDGYNAVTRLFDRLALREFERRVVFQMSAADSSNLLDTPAASRLSQHRALLYNDETGEAEKFRPYSMPTDEWLAEVAATFDPAEAIDKA